MNSVITSERGVSSDNLTRYLLDVHAKSDLLGENETLTFIKYVSIEISLLCTVLSQQFVDDISKDFDFVGEDPDVYPSLHGFSYRTFSTMRTHKNSRVTFENAVQEALKDPKRHSHVKDLLDRRAAVKKALISANLRLSIYISRMFISRCKFISLNDLIQEGNLGMIESIERFDPTKGFKFITYASWWVKHYITRAIQDYEPLISIPVNIQELQRELNKIEIDTVNKTGKSASISELAKKTGRSVDTIERVMSVKNSHTISLDSPGLGLESEDTVHSVIPSEDPDPYDVLVSSYDKSCVKELMECLTPIQRDIIEKRFGINNDNNDSGGVTLSEVAKGYSLSRERIRQLEAGAIQTMRSRALKLHITS